MAKPWVAILFLALTAGTSILSITTRVQPPPFAIRAVHGTSTWSEWLGIPDPGRNSSLKSGSRWCYHSRTAIDDSQPTKDLPYSASDLHPGVQSSKSNCLEFDIYYHGSDIKKVEDGTVCHPQACQQMCVQIPGCAYWTYVSKTSSCYLKSRAAPQERKWTPSAVSGSRTCPFACDSCYEMDTGYYGSDMKVFVDHLVRSAEECHLVCLAFPACHFWTWVSSQLNCYLKNEHAPTGRFHVPGSISGPRQCVAAVPPSRGGCYDPGSKGQSCYEHECYDHNVLYAGIDVEAKRTASGPKECQYFCQQHRFCRGFSYLPMEKKCTLKSSQGTILPHPNAVSGPKYCYTPDCAIKDVIYYDKEIETKFTPSFAACHKLCQYNPLCSAVTFHEASQQCSQRQRAEYTRGFVSGPKWCKPRGRKVIGTPAAAIESGTAYTSSLKESVCYDAGLAYTSRPFSVNHSESAELCHRHCEADPRCKFFTYYYFGKICLMHDHEGQRVPNETAASGSRLCAVSTSACFYEDVEVYGKDVGQCTVESAAACQMVCQRNEQCSFFVYQVASKLCLQRQHRGHASGNTSAPVFCGMPDDDITLLHERPETGPGAPSGGDVIPEKPDTNGKLPEKPDGNGNGKLPGKPDTNGKLPEKPDGNGNGKLPGKPDTNGKLPEKPDGNGKLPEKPDGNGKLPEKPDGNGKLPESPVPEKPDVDPCTSPDSNCFNTGFYNDSEAIEESVTESVDECQKKCVDKDMCNYFSFFRDSGVCTLHILEGNRMLKREAVTGPWKCGEEPRSKQCVVLGGYHGQEVLTNKVDSLIGCYKLCFFHEDCKYFSYMSDQRTCRGFEEVSALVQYERAVSGPKSCASGYTNPCIQHGISCSGKQGSASTYAESTEGCLAACRKEKSCAYYSYNKEKKKCTLIEDFRGDNTESDSVCGAKYCVSLSFDPACFHFDSSYNISEPKAVQARSFTECYLLCAKEKGCRFFTFDGRSKCELGEKVIGLMDRARGVAGPLHCPARFISESCITKSLRYVGDKLETLEKVTELAECKQKCAAKSQQCRFFTLKDKTCTLFKTKTWSVSDREAISGWVGCPDETMCKDVKGVDARHHRTYSLRKGGFKQCEDECRDSPSCTTAAWDPSGEAADCYVSALFRIEPAHISGPVSCDAKVSPLWTSLWGGQTPKSNPPEPNSCIKEKTSSSATPFNRSSAASTEACQKKCQQHCGCRFFSYNTTEGVCSLYKRSTSPTEQVGHESASPWCNPPPVNCAAENIAVEGISIKEEKTKSLETCVKLCKDSSGSAYYTFDTFTHHCSCGYHQKPGDYLRTMVKACL